MHEIRANCSVIFFIMAMRLQHKTPSAIIDSKSLEWVVLYPTTYIRTCGADQNRFFLCSWREQNSVIKVWNAKSSSSHLLSINVFNNTENIAAFKEKLRSQTTALIYLRAFVSQKARRNHVLHNIHHSTREKRNLMLFLTYNAVLRYGIFFCDKKEIAKQNAGLLNCQDTQLERFFFYN